MTEQVMLPIVVGLLMAVLCIFIMSKSPRRTAAKPPALAAEKAEPRKYSYDDLVRDLDTNVPIDEILERCGGVFPDPPAKGAVLPRSFLEGSPSSTAFPDDPEGTAVMAETTKKEPEGRDAERQAWFKDMLQTTPEVKVVPPPPLGTPIVSMGGWPILCHCKRSPGGLGMPTVSFTRVVPFGSMHLPRPVGTTCESCGGRGFVIMAGR